MKRRKFLLIAAAALGSLGIGGGAAYGYFTSHGSGSSTARAGTMQTVTIAAISGETPNATLLPGSTGEVIVKVDNTNTSPVRLVSVVADGSITASGGSGCTTANSGVSFTNQTGLSTTVPASTTLLVRLPGAASMSSSSASGCQGATFNIPVTITVEMP